MRLRLLGSVLAIGLVLTLSRAAAGGARYIVVLQNGASIDAVNQAHGTSTLRQIKGTSIYLVQTNTDDDNGVIFSQLANDAAVATVEPNVHIKLRSPAQAPLDPSLANLSASQLDGQTLTTFYGTTVLQSYINQPALGITHVNDVRRISTGAGTRIAYIDTGVDFYHPALRPWLDPGVNVLNHSGSASELDGLSQVAAELLDQQGISYLDKRFTFVLDAILAELLDGGDTGRIFPQDLGHGTLVAGILHLVAPEARIVPIKAFTAYGNTTIFALTEAVYQAKELGVDVLNMSFSTRQDSPAFRKALMDAHAAGVALVASAGNDANGTVTYFPASYPNVIGVAATDFSDRLAGFSNYGSAVAVDAPGAYVVSTVPGGKYAAAWGTSFSAPIVSGEIALLASSRGHGHSTSSLVVSTADSIDGVNPGFAGMLGRGRINALQALKFAR
jgi:subtilisin family serine protease